MPIYSYLCQACGETVEKRQTFSDAALTTCEACGGELRKVIHPVGIVFKGSGFYNTDYRGNNGAPKKTDESAGGDGEKAAAGDATADSGAAKGADGSAKGDAAKSDGAGSSSKSDGAKSEGARSEGGRSEGARSEGGRSEGGRSEGGRSEGGKSESAKSEGAKTGSASGTRND